MPSGSPPTTATACSSRSTSTCATRATPPAPGAAPTEAFGIATDDGDGVFLSVDIDVCDPGHAPGTGTPEPGGLTARELLDAVRRIAYELPVVGMDVVEGS